MPLRLPWIACLLLALSQPVCAAPAAPSDLRSDILYTSRGEFLQVTPMHALTLNAHIQQFAYEPLGIEVAFAGFEIQGDQTIHFVKTMDVRSGHEISRLSFTAPTTDHAAGFTFLGWSPSSKYLLVMKRFLPDPQISAEYKEEYLRWDLTAISPSTTMIDLVSHLPSEAKVNEDNGYGVPSPNRHWIHFTQPYKTLDAEGKLGEPIQAHILYDTERDTYRLLNLPPKSFSLQWSDENHLRLRLDDTFQQFDVTSEKISPLLSEANSDTAATSKQYPDLTLETEYRDQNDVKDSGGHLDSCLLWIRRTSGAKKPLGVAAAGLTPSADNPQAVWSPTGKQVAFLSQGDLYVTNLVAPSDQIPSEKLALGVTLTCAEERQLASVNLKRIGLALIQYAQDNNENYPPSADINEAIYPYLKTRYLFQVGSHPFVYLLPGGTSLMKIDSPAETEQGMIDLPCARVVLFADGHVKVFTKPLSLRE